MSSIRLLRNAIRRRRKPRAGAPKRDTESCVIPLVSPTHTKYGERLPPGAPPAGLYKRGGVSARPEGSGSQIHEGTASAARRILQFDAGAMGIDHFTVTRLGLETSNTVPGRVSSGSTTADLRSASFIPPQSTVRPSFRFSEISEMDRATTSST